MAEAKTDLLGVRLSKWEADLRGAHVEHVETARKDAQKAGHQTEGIWVKVAREILPPSYRVLSRKYIGSEVDIVMTSPTSRR